MTDENKAGRARRATAPAPLPRQSSRPPEPRPRTQVPENAVALLPSPPRLIRPSEHLAIVERAKAQKAEYLSPDRRPHTAPEGYRPDSIERIERRQMQPETLTIVERRPMQEAYVDRPMERRSDPRASQSLAVMERPVERRPPHLVPSVTVLQGPRPSLPPQIPAHRAVAPPPPRMPAPVPQPVMRLPQPRRDIQVNSCTCPKSGKFVRIRCPLCFKIFGKETVASTKCGHVFCINCLKKSLSKQSNCPTCKTKLRGCSGHHIVYLEDMTDEGMLKYYKK